MKQDWFEKSRQYALAHYKFNYVEEVFLMAAFLVTIFFKLFGKLWDLCVKVNHQPKLDGELARSCLWVFIFVSSVSIIGLPFAIYFVCGVQKKYTTTQITARIFVLEIVKTYIGIVISFILFAILIVVIAELGGKFAVIWLWIALAATSLILLLLYPVCLGPCLESFSELPEGPLKDKIEELCNQVKFPLKQVCCVKETKNAQSHSNAYFVGMCGSKKILIYESLFKTCTDEEILAILCHELGHWKHNHSIKLFFITQADLLVKFALFCLFIHYPVMYKAFGISGAQPVIVGLIIFLLFILLPYNNLFLVFVNYLSRRFEFQSDGFAVQFGRGEALKTGLLRLYLLNLVFPCTDSWYSVWYYRHPPLLERIAAIDDKMSRGNV